MRISNWHAGSRRTKETDLKTPAIGISFPIPPAFAGEITIVLIQDVDSVTDARPRCVQSMSFDEAEDYGRRILAQVAEARKGVK